MITERGRGWVAEVEGHIVGFAVGDRVHANVWALFVDHAHECRGVGKTLHDSMMSWLFGEGVERVWLGTDPGTRAERFYRAAGWQYLGHHHGEAKYELSPAQWMRRIAGVPPSSCWSRPT
jgi:GNAT superfamily N-acetyltransferase